ncbi:MAG: GNAT family N-acetyltransferase [Clostridia bacterium]
MKITIIDIDSNQSRKKFWQLRDEYLERDILDKRTISEKSDIHLRKWLLSDEYKTQIHSICERDIDRGRMVFFMNADVIIGFSSYCAYLSEDGKCFIIDFCVLPEFRGHGIGIDCFNAIEKKEKARGTVYFSLNSANDDAARFWKRLGFEYNGVDAHGTMLLMQNPTDNAEVSFEEFDTKDFDQLKELLAGYKYAIGENLPEEAQLENLLLAIREKKIIFFIAKRKTRIIGICSLSELFSTYKCKPVAMFEDFYVMPVYRHKGIARGLINRVFEVSGQLGIQSILVGANECDVQMYKSLGFKNPIGTLLAGE